VEREVREFVIAPSYDDGKDREEKTWTTKGLQHLRPLFLLRILPNPPPHIMSCPPFTSKVAPVIYEDISEAKKRTALAVSCGSANLPRGIREIS
jgi:hypothetical protein